MQAVVNSVCTPPWRIPNTFLPLGCLCVPVWRRTCIHCWRRGPCLGTGKVGLCRDFLTSLVLVLRRQLVRCFLDSIAPLMLSHFQHMSLRGKSNDIWWQLLSSKLIRVALTTVVILLVLGGLWQRTASGSRDIWPHPFRLVATTPSENAALVAHPGKGRLHMLIPATSSNTDLCKLLLSAQILRYPTPQLINYGDAEDLEDPYKQHLAKVEGILEYLEKLHASTEYSQDLVLIIDGYDIFMQLRPDVLIKRYYEVIEAADARTRARHGDTLFHKYDMRQTIIFGPDKLCVSRFYNYLDTDQH
jgi:hypothetical protein